jgi:hypothetical protein
MRSNSPPISYSLNCGKEYKQLRLQKKMHCLHIRRYSTTPGILKTRDVSGVDSYEGRTGWANYLLGLKVYSINESSMRTWRREYSQLPKHPQWAWHTQ